MCRRRSVFLLLVALMLLAGWLPARPTLAQSQTQLCFDKPWRPAQSLLKDHALFSYDGYYYVVATHLPVDTSQRREQHFVYARTRDFCQWEDLGTILQPGAAGSPDEDRIWAPHVISFGRTWYMFYTGVNKNIAQTIMLATSTNPADPASWKPRGAVFHPTHKGAYYPGPTAWSDGRDPMILYDWVSNQYVMYYSGYDSVGCRKGLTICGIIGAATARLLDGPWQDRGAVLKLDTPGIPESSYVVAPGIGGTYYLFYNHAVGGGAGGQKVVMASTALGPWSTSERFLPGWASDFFQSSDGWVMSYLGNYTIAVTHLVWNTAYTPARPMSVNERRSYLSILLH